MLGAEYDHNGTQIVDMINSPHSCPFGKEYKILFDNGRLMPDSKTEIEHSCYGVPYPVVNFKTLVKGGKKVKDRGAGKREGPHEQEKGRG